MKFGVISKSLPVRLQQLSGSFVSAKGKEQGIDPSLLFSLFNV
jgi:hypothetical protein